MEPLIKKSAKRQFAPLNIFLRKCSVHVAYYLNKLGITPNQVLFFRVIFFGGGSLPLFYSENYIYNLVGLFLITLCYFFDLVDGDLARNHDKMTKTGWFLDMNFDAIVLNSIILTFILRFEFHGDRDIFMIAGIMILFGTIFSSKMTELFQNQFGINCGQGSDVVEEYLKSHTLDKVSAFTYRLITPKRFPMTLFSNFREYLLIGVLTDSMPIAIAGFAIAINLRWSMLFIMAALYYHSVDTGTSRYTLFRLMKQSEK